MYGSMSLLFRSGFKKMQFFLEPRKIIFFQIMFRKMPLRIFKTLYAAAYCVAENLSRCKQQFFRPQIFKFGVCNCFFGCSFSAAAYAGKMGGGIGGKRVLGVCKWGKGDSDRLLSSCKFATCNRRHLQVGNLFLAFNAGLLREGMLAKPFMHSLASCKLARTKRLEFC